MISTPDMNEYRAAVALATEEMSRSVYLGYNNYPIDDTIAKYMVVQLFEMHNLIGVELTADEIDVLSNFILMGRLCC